MNEVILAKYGEIVLKGNNRSKFESTLRHNIRQKLKKFGDFTLTYAQSTIYIEPNEDVDLYAVLEEMQCVFGIATLCLARCCAKDMVEIERNAVEYLRETLEMAKSFKVESKRSDKSFPLTSPEISAQVGDALAEAYPQCLVDLHNPSVTVRVEIREKYAFIHGTDVKGAGGLPVGTCDRAMLLLSGGIDSPVAGYRMARRGVHISAIHFEAPPYTSERAREKVEQLADAMTRYCGNISFFCVPFTEIQEAIRRHCPADYFTVIMRRLMMEIALRIAKREYCFALVTGESLGQVASQTMQALMCTDAVADIPVLRPLIALDKTEIIDTARQIGTYDISIQPYEDCCTVFTPKHPKLRPTVEETQRAQDRFDFTEMIDRAVAGTTLRVFHDGDIVGD